MRKKISALPIVLLILSLILTVGVRLVFHACLPHEDGSWMACHWAEQAVFALGLVLCVQSALLTALDQPGLALAMVPTAGMAAILPNNLIRLCMMKEMRCHAVMRPAAIALGAVIAAVALADFILENRKGR